jgi:hypothetical protein
MPRLKNVKKSENFENRITPEQIRHYNILSNYLYDMRVVDDYDEPWRTGPKGELWGPLEEEKIKNGWSPMDILLLRAHQKTLTGIGK